MSQRIAGSGRDQTAVVVGAGIVGLCCAHQLQKAGYAVTVLDRAEPGQSTAAGSCGILATTHVAPLALPGSLSRVGAVIDGPGPMLIRSQYISRLLPFLVPFYALSRPDAAEAISEKLSQVNRFAVEALAEILADVDAAELLKRRGWLYVYESDESFRAAQPELDFRRRRGWRVDLLTGDQAREMEPALGPSIRHAVYLPEAADVTDPVEAMRRIAHAVMARGGQIVQEEVTELEADANGVVSVQSATGAYEGSVVVLAAGPWSSGLLAKVGLTIPDAPEAGSSITFPDANIRLRYPVSSSDHKCVVNCMADGFRLTTGADFTDLSAPADYAQSERLTAVAKRLFPALQDKSPVRWYGIRSAMPDSLPAIGRSLGHKNLVVAFGHGHLGLTLAGVTANLVCSLLGAGPGALDPELFRPDRFDDWLQPAAAAQMP